MAFLNRATLKDDLRLKVVWFAPIAVKMSEGTVLSVCLGFVQRF